MGFSLWGKPREGYVVRVANNSPEALRIANSWLPDVALLDLGMPIIDGLQLGRLLRNVPNLARLPLIAVSGHAGAEYRTLAKAVGFTDYIIKPVAPSALLLLLATVRTGRAAPSERDYAQVLHGLA